MLPVEFTSSIDAVKTPTANMTEGTLGGNIDVKTFHPLDVGNKTTVNLRGIYTSQTDKVKPNATVITSATNASSALGILAGAQYWEKAVRNDRFLNFGRNMRRKSATLAAAVHSKGWPTLEAARGRIYILLDVRTAVSDAYRAGYPSLRGRAMFGWYPDGKPENAIQIVHDALVDGTRIRDWVMAGVIERKRTDVNAVEARTRDLAKAVAAMDSGAQAISTDYYPGAPDP